ncbi:MAG: sensor histidine kinase [Cyclobacteriaceae bacterium]
MLKKQLNIKTIVSHAIFWVGYFAFLLYFLSGRSPSEVALLRSVIFICLQMAFAYLNTELLMPTFFLKKRYPEYIFLVLIIFIALFFVYDFIDQQTIPGRKENILKKFQEGNHQRNESGFMSRFIYLYFRVIMNIVLTTAIYLLSTAYIMISEAGRREKEAAILKGEKLHSELKFLKSQINPHFLFNALNNIYALTVIKSDAAPEVILKLSDMLRYIIYDCNEDKVPLKKEITYIKNYIDLQKLKEEHQGNIQVDFSNVNSNQMVAPLLFIPFIENSFKHSKIEDQENGWIKIKLETNDQWLAFEAENSIPNSPHAKDAQGGIGLENVQKRLSLLYAGKHELNIRQSSKEFSVKLKILL